MKKEVKLCVAKCALIISAAPLLVNAYEYGPDAGAAGVPGENGSCSQSGCHTGTPVNGGGGSVTVTFPNGMTYTAGSKQHLAVAITDSTRRKWGFELTARLANDPSKMTGTFSPTDKRTQLMCSSRDLVQFDNFNIACPASLPIQYIEQTLAGYSANQPNPGKFEFDWNAPASDVGPVTVYVSAVAANGDLTQNGDHVYTAGYTLVATAAQACNFTLSAKPQSFPKEGGPGVVDIVATSATCARTVTTTVNWITVLYGQQGTGNGSSGFTVAPNTDTPSRSGSITVGGQSITITQVGPPCNFAINPNLANVSAAALIGSVALTGLSGCTWTASSNAPWLQVTSASSGMGPATIAYTVQANPVTMSRSGTISIAGLTFTVNQAGVCAYAANPSSGSYPSSGGNGTFAISSNSGCAWIATPSTSWIRITSGRSGSGPGQVAFAVDPNTGDARTATIAVAGQTFTLSQASQSCSFTLSPAAASAPAAGGTALFSVAAPTSCAWTAAASATWITIVTDASASGNGVVGISVPWNTGDARTGAITVGNQIFTVTQPSGMIRADAVVNSANSVAGPVSPGMIVTIAAPKGIGPADTVTKQLSADGPFLTTLLGGTRVLFDGVAAPMLYAASGQFSAVVPYEVDGKEGTQMQIEYQGTRSNIVNLPVVPSAPGLFGLILDAQGNPNSDANPAVAGSVVTLYGTGEGQTSPPGIDGLIATDPAPAPVLPVSVTIDGINAPVLYYGGAVGQVAGMMRIDVQIPDGAASGARPVVVQVGDTQSQTSVTVAIQ